jgi:hypothetical protein
VPALRCLGAGVVDRSGGVVFDQAAQAHDGTQRFGSAQLKGALSPLAAFFAKHPSSPSPVAARTDDRSMQAYGAQHTAKLTWFNAAMDLDLFHPVIEDSYATTVPAPKPSCAVWKTAYIRTARLIHPAARLVNKRGAVSPATRLKLCRTLHKRFRTGHNFGDLSVPLQLYQ